MTRLRDTSKQVDRSLYIQPLLGVYCSAKDTSSALKTCEYINVTLCMPLIWTPLYSFCVFGVASENEISLAQTTLCACLWYEHHYSFCVFGAASQMKSVEFKQLSPYQLYTYGVACWEVTWPNDLQTRFCQYTGIPLGRPHWKATGATSALGSHWNHTGWCWHPVVFQWRSGVNLHNWNTLEDYSSHENTRMPLEPHWLMLASSAIPVAIQC